MNLLGDHIFVAEAPGHHGDEKGEEGLQLPQPVFVYKIKQEYSYLKIKGLVANATLFGFFFIFTRTLYNITLSRFGGLQGLWLSVGLM